VTRAYFVAASGGLFHHEIVHRACVDVAPAVGRKPSSFPCYKLASDVMNVPCTFEVRRCICV
jgi:hypothetical protein